MVIAGHLLLRFLPPPAMNIVKAGPSSTGLWSISARSQQEEGGGRSGRRIWRRRRLTKNDDKLSYKMDRIPFLEEQVRRIRENGTILSLDIDTLMRSAENRFNFVNEVAEEANSYIQNNRDDYGAKKAILHVLSNRMNEAGFERPEAYMEDDPYKPGPSYLKDLPT